MKKTLIILSILSSSFLFISGQTDPVLSQYMFNKMLYNPGAAGNSSMICATAGSRQQWVGLTGAPKTTFLNVNAAIKPFGINSGLGLSVINDKAGFDSDIAILLTYAYLMNVGNGKLGIGANFGLINKAIDPKWSIPEGAEFTQENGDPLIPVAKESVLSFDMSVGVYYNTNDYYLGISIAHINEAKIKYLDSTPFVPRQYYVLAGYNLRLPNPAFEILPSTMIFSDGKIFQPTINILLRYNKKVWGGVSYRNGDALTGIFGIELFSGVRFSYAYDFPFNDIKKSSSGSHEFLVNYCFDLSFGKKSMKYKSIRFL